MRNDKYSDKLADITNDSDGPGEGSKALQSSELKKPASTNYREKLETYCANLEYALIRLTVLGLLIYELIRFVTGV
jgi:hypothetical protein